MDVDEGEEEVDGGVVDVGGIVLFMRENEDEDGKATETGGREESEGRCEERAGPAAASTRSAMIELSCLLVLLLVLLSVKFWLLTAILLVLLLSWSSGSWPFRL